MQIADIHNTKKKIKKTFKNICTNRKNALPLHRQKQRNKPVDDASKYVAEVAQLVRASDCGSEGHRFESYLRYFSVKSSQK